MAAPLPQDKQFYSTTCPGTSDPVWASESIESLLVMGKAENSETFETLVWIVWKKRELWKKQDS